MRTALLFVPLMLLVAPDGFSDNSHRTQAQSSKTDTHTIPVVVDGAITPDLVSDRVAYRHFFKALALSGNTPRASERWRLLVRRLGLTPSDEASLRSHLNAATPRLQTVGGELERAAALDAAGADLLKRQYIQALDDLTEAVHSALTANAALALQEYIRRDVKRRIVIYGALPPD